MKLKSKPMKLKAKLLITLIVFVTSTLVLMMVTMPNMASLSVINTMVYFVSFLLILISATALMYILLESLIKPVSKLKKAFQHIGEGDVDYIIDYDTADDLGEIAVEFEKMRMQLKTDRETNNQFRREHQELIANISHDLKTPITSIKGYCEGIQDGMADTPEKLEQYIKTIHNKAIDMDRLIDELSYYAKIDTNRIPYNFVKISITDFFDDAAEELGMELKHQGIIFNYENRIDGNANIIADAEQLRKVVNNIVNNSIKYIDKIPGTITVRLCDEGDFVRIEIEDNGRGISQQDLQYIFERFYRTHSSRNSKTGGSGIGLSIVKKIMEDHGGKIWAKSQENEGTTIIFIIRKYLEENYEQNSNS